MPRVVFTSNLARHVDCPPAEVEGRTVRAAIDAALAASPELRGYVVDEHGRVRKHVAIFVGGNMVRDKEGLSDSVGPRDEIYIMQALSGG